MANDESIITKTNDGYVVELFVNTTTEEKVEDNYEGITILEPAKSLVEDDLFEIYKEITDKMDDKPVTVKTPEIAKDIIPLKTQLRALLRAAKWGDLSIVFPKVSTIIELKQYKEVLEECKNELELENTEYRKYMKYGIIIEIPSAALMSYEMARECDFFLIDTNSLTNYAFGNKKNPDLAKTFQPTIIKLIQQTTEGAHDAGIFCGICGNATENELYIPLLIGLEIDEFSMDSQKITKARNIISELDKSDCKELVKDVIQLRTLEDIERKIKQFTQD